jgi:hypothetical protein
LGRQHRDLEIGEMTRRTSVPASPLVALALLGSVTSCNSILGIGDPSVRDAGVESPGRDVGVGPIDDANTGVEEPTDAASTPVREAEAGSDARIEIESAPRDAAPPGADVNDASVAPNPDTGNVNCASGSCALLAQDAGYAPTNIAQDETYLYWTEFLGGRIGRTHKTTGATVVLHQTPLGNPLGIAVDGTSVYWTDNLPGVWRCPKDGCGGGPTFISSVDDMPYNLAVDDRNVYWTDRANSVVRAAPKDGVDAAFATLWQNRAVVPDDISTDGQRVYFTGLEGKLYRMTVDGGGLAVFAASGDGGTGSAVALDNSAAYWAVNSPSSTVNIAGKTSAASSALASSQTHPIDLASDGINLYWLNFGAGPDGALLTCPIASCGSPAVLARNLGYPQAIVVDSAAVYWIQSEPGLLHSSVWRLSK